MNKGIIFDFNGTLFFDEDKHIQAWQQISQEIRKKGITKQELQTSINGVPNKQTIIYLLGYSPKEEEIIYWSLRKEEIYRSLCKQDIHNFKLVDGVIPYFNYLKSNNIPFTIASASIKENIDFFISSFHLDTWIKTEDIIYDNGSYTNKVNMFIDACKNLKLSTNEVVVFEDSVSGIQCAYEAGISNIVVICSPEDKEKYSSLPGVIKIIKDYQDLDVLLNL